MKTATTEEAKKIIKAQMNKEKMAFNAKYYQKITN